MKKLLALLTALMMLFSVTAFAETVTFEDLYDGVWMRFEDDGFELYLPSDWLQLQITDEILSTGIYYAIVSPDLANAFTVSWALMDELFDIDTLEAAINMVYPGATRVALGYAEAVCYTDTASDMLAFAILDPDGMGMYTFSFMPASTEGMQLLASLTMLSFRPLSK